MSKDHRINLRFSEVQLRDITRRAEMADLPIATYVRGLIQKDIARDHDAVVKRLGRLIINTTFSIGKLYTLLDCEGEIDHINQEVEKLLKELEQHID